MIEPYGHRWYSLSVNPEPWEIGPVSVVRRGAKLMPSVAPSQQLVYYKHAVHDILENRYPNDWSCELPPHYSLDFFFWRDTTKGNYADATNLQKATEDALQGILIGNDRDVIRVCSTVVEQGPDVSAAVIFRIEWGIERNRDNYADKIPASIMAELNQYRDLYERAREDDNSWPPR